MSISIRSRARFGLAPLALTAAVLCSTTPSTHANERHDPSNRTYPNITLPGILNGQAAIRALAQHWPTVAASYGHTPEALRDLFLNDDSLHVDEKGRLLYLERVPAPEGAGEVQGATMATADASYPLSETFLLHSRPGASRVIYLDFDGHVLSGTAWNSGKVSTINCPPWDIDGNSSSFGDLERTRIQGIWRRVAEDYLPFDVDVTTQYPGEAAMTRSASSDLVFGMRVLISPISSYFGNYGGIAYVGVFDYTGDFYKPALVFPEKLGNQEKYIAEAVSHEAGHTLGLSHDGTASVSYYQGSGSGDTGWAPIMGVGYYQNLSQWSKGEYTGANNKEDDLVVMQSNGLTYRTDDHGNTIASARFLPASAALSADGIIERNTDVDVFGFVTGAGTISLTVTPAISGPNLDVLAELYRNDGVKIGSSNPVGSLGASLSLSVPAGTYYLFVRGTGQGDPLTGYSTYASLGAYAVNGLVVSSSDPIPPVAGITATPVSGIAPLPVQFNAGQSYDPDGTIASYAWNFGDGTIGTGSMPSHTYTLAGSYTAAVTVTDNSGLTASTSMTISVAQPNLSPTARITTTSLGSTAPLTVTFDGSSSTDPDGTIASYQWNFGDGLTGTGAVVQHVYSAGGTFTAVLTVTDNRGATSTASVLITVQANLTSIMRVGSITVTTSTSGAWTTASAIVTILDGSATPKPVGGATVTGSWSGAVSGSSSGTTDSTGKVTLTSKRYKKANTVNLTVTNVSKAGMTYDPTKNAVSKASGR